jgi:hypothetical protein
VTGHHGNRVRVFWPLSRKEDKWGGSLLGKKFVTGHHGDRVRVFWPLSRKEDKRGGFLLFL